MSASKEGVTVTVNQRDHVVTFDDDKSTTAQQKEMQHILTLYNALTQFVLFLLSFLFFSSLSRIGELSESVAELKQKIPRNKVLKIDLETRGQ